MGIRSALGKHKCGDCANFYNERTQSLCPKIADYCEEVCRTYTASVIDAIKESKRIEKYDFIEEGAECVNYDRGYFAVGECLLFQPNAEEDRQMKERELSREWLERQRELKKEFEEPKPLSEEMLRDFGYATR